MAKHPLIAPSILAADHAALGEEIRNVEAAGADPIHIDVMDGHFVPNLTLGPPIIQSLRRVTTLPFDVHLMIEAPERSIDQYIKAGANIVTVHAEACVHLHRVLGYIREQGVKVGVSLNPATPLNAIEHVLHMVDMVLIMSVNPGFGGQKFIPEVLPKISELRHTLTTRGLNVDIEVDGGVTEQTIGDISRAGANIFVAGSAVFGSKNYGATVAALKKSAV